MQSATAEGSISNREHGTSRKGLLGSGILVFGISVLFALLFHFSAEVPRRTLCFDARQYLFDIARISEFLIAIFHFKWQPALVSDQLFVTSILADGPAFPTVFGAFFAVLGHVPGINDCRAIEIFQSLLHSSSACMIFGLSYLLNRRLWLALVSGLIWGLYPAAVFWSGILYTESTVIFFALAFVTALSFADRRVQAFCAGLLAGFVALLKPALLPAAAVSSLLSYRFKKLSFLLVILGLLCSLAPWMAYTKLLTGQVKITAQRFPAFNLAMGSDSEVDGCLVSPAPPLTTMFSREDAQPIAFPLSQWEFHTADCLRMSAVKLSALWSRPANDFRQKYFGLSCSVQNYWHLVLVFFGLSGIILYLLSFRSAFDSKQQETAALASLIFIGTHFCYILFTPAARYGLTAMPFFLIFASFAVNFVIKNGKKVDWKLLVSVFLSFVLVLLMQSGRELSKVFVFPEIAVKLAPAQAVLKQLDLSKLAKPASIYSVILLVDGDQSIERASVEVNGHKLDGHLKHLRSFDSTLYLQSFELRSLGYPSGIATDEFRHWRGIVVPADYINWQGINQIKVTQQVEGSTIYADPKASRQMLALDYFSVNSLCNSDTSLDLRIPSPILTADIKESSEILSGSSRKQIAPLRIKLAVALGEAYKGAGNTGKLIYSETLNPKLFDLYIQDPTINGIRANRINMKAARSMGVTRELPELPNSSILRVKVSGELKGKNKGRAELVIALQPSVQGQALVLNMTPETIPYGPNWNSFQIEDSLQSKLLDPKAKHSIYLAVYPGRWLDFCGYVADKSCGDAQFRNLKIEIFSDEAPDLAGKRKIFY
ncbi:MAG: hypothetical protein K2X27_00795 [Candidatus Obscuribacterales bacterium]|nr:hypothetical protein [Candidatus Obscuribacterales bacterium]